MATSTVAKTAAVSAQVNILDGYSSIVGNDLETRKRVFNAVSAAVKISENLDKPIKLVDILVQQVSGEDEKTGEVEEYHRVTLIDSDGVAYAAGSKGLINSVQTILAVFGQPNTWDAPLDIIIVERKAPRGKFFSLEVL